MGRLTILSLILIGCACGPLCAQADETRSARARAFLTPPAMPPVAAFLSPPRRELLPISLPAAERRATPLRVNLRPAVPPAGAASWQHPQEAADATSGAGPAPADSATAPEIHEGFRWGSALKQSLLFLAVQHGYAFTQPKTRRELKGPFFRDYFASVKSLRGWADGGRFFTNYMAHPMQGSLTGFIQVQNDPRGMREPFGGSRRYWVSRLKAAAWAAAFSTQFELGPISQASIGNVGKHGKQTYVDLVITPTVGTAWLITEDALDRHVVARIERASDNFYLRIAARLLLNPTRSCANLLRFKKPWHRDVQR